jgi:propionate CoA-transferase
MNTTDKLKLLAHAIKWRLTWNHHDLDYIPENSQNKKFITARDAAKLISDDAVVFSSGLAGNGRCTIFYHAIRDRFVHEEHPKNLTWIHCGAQGGRGKVPGTIEEVGLPGLMKRYIAGHIETAKAQLALAEQGLLEICILSQGVISMLLEEQAHGNNILETEVGVGTFIDPRTGRGSSLTEGSACPFVNVAPNGKLQYTLPLIRFALCSASYADPEGNIYFHHSNIISESLPAAAAAKYNGGKVMVSVGGIIPKNESLIRLKANDVDYIVVDPYHEQAASIPIKHYWPMFVGR